VKKYGLECAENLLKYKISEDKRTKIYGGNE